MASTPLQKSVCPSCGAPVSLDDQPDDATEITCAYCGTVLRTPQVAKPAAPQPTVIHVDLGRMMNTTPTVQHKPGAASFFGGCVVPIGVLVVIVVSLLGSGVLKGVLPAGLQRTIESVTNRSATPGALKDVLQNVTPSPNVVRILATEPNDGAGPAGVIAVLTTDYANYFVGNVHPGQRKAGWRVPVSKEHFATIALAQAGSAYVIDGDSVLAVDSNSGEVKWRASMSRGIQSPCESCAMVIGNQLITLARDGSLQAFDTRTGGSTYSKRLEASTRQLWPLGDRFAVSEPTAAKPSVYTFNIYNAANGERVRSIDASCRPAMTSILAEPRSDTFRVSPDGNALIAIWDSTYACAARFDITTGKQIWTRSFKNGEGWPFSVSAFGNFVRVENDQVLAYSIDGGGNKEAAIMLLDIGTGAMRKFDLPKDYTLSQVGRFNLDGKSLLIAKAQNKFDGERERGEAWGIDTVAGRRVWQSSFSASNKDMAQLEIHATAAGVFAAHRIEIQLLLYRFNPATGTSEKPLTIALDFPSTTLGWQPDSLWVVSGRNGRVVDLKTLQVVSQW